MKLMNFLSFKRKLAVIIAACLVVLAANTFPAYSQQMPMPDKPKTVAKTQDKPDDSGAMDEEELPHGFFTHEGLPDEVGSFSLRTSVLAMRIDGATKGDFAFHLETGLTKQIGLPPIS